MVKKKHGKLFIGWEKPLFILFVLLMLIEIAGSVTAALCYGFLVISFVVCVAHLLDKKRREMILASGIYFIDTMEGTKFEEFLLVLFRQLGFWGEQTPYNNDYGADLVLIKGNIKYVVQAKRSSKNIGVKAVQEIVGAVRYYDADQGIVVTNRFYTPQAIKLARSNKIELCDRVQLIKKLNACGSKGIEEILYNEDGYIKNLASIICPHCGKRFGELNYYRFSWIDHFMFELYLFINRTTKYWKKIVST